jgi:hypothetical protein
MTLVGMDQVARSDQSLPASGPAPGDSQSTVTSAVRQEALLRSRIGGQAESLTNASCLIHNRRMQGLTRASIGNSVDTSLKEAVWKSPLASGLVTEDRNAHLKQRVLQRQPQVGEPNG